MPRISESEWVIANIVWNEPNLTAVQVLERLPKGNLWKQKTVNTFLTRLAAKGVLGIQKEGKANCYFPKVDRLACVEEVSESLFERVFGGAFGPMLAHFCKTAPLSNEEIEKLKAILDSRETESKGKD